MTETSLLDAMARLDALEAQLNSEDALGAEAQSTVILDQQAVGRLSRQDALQAQEMAKATQLRRDQQRLRLAAARKRVEDGEYGFCAECGEEIAPKRLALDPTLQTCVSCARG